MNETQNKLLGGYAAIRINNQDEFKKVIEFLAIKNCFLANKEPVSKMNYPGSLVFAMYRADDGFIYWSPIADIDLSKYELFDVKDLELEAIDDQTVLDANATVIEEVTELSDSNMTLVVMKKPESSAIPSNVDDLLKLIPLIKSKANIVVTEDNYKSFVAKGSGIVPILRKYAKNLKDEKKKIKDSYMQSFDEFSNNVDKVINALEESAKKIDDNVKHFTNHQKEILRKERVEEINKLKSVLIENKMISEDYANKFVFDEKWLNSNCSTKRFKEEVEKQFNSLIEKEKSDKQNIELIENTIINTCQIAAVDEKLINRDKYLLLVRSGQNLGDVTKLITDDVNALKKQKDGLLEAQKREELLREERFKKQQEEAEKCHQEELKQVSGNNLAAAPNTNINIFADEKTGELYAKANDKAITVAIQEAPAKVPDDKIFSYTYRFEGNCRAILTFNKFLKTLSKVFKSFKYMEVK